MEVFDYERKSKQKSENTQIFLLEKSENTQFFGLCNADYTHGKNV